MLVAMDTQLERYHIAGNFHIFHELFGNHKKNETDQIFLKKCPCNHHSF